MTFHTDLLAAAPQLRGYIAYLVRDPQAVDDLLQDVMAKALHHEANFLPGSNMAAWLTTIARNAYFTQRRKTWRNVEMIEGWDVATPESQFDHVALQDLKTAMETRLSSQENEMLYSHVFEGRTHEEAAVHFGVPIGTIKSRVFRAREKLADFR